MTLGDFSNYLAGLPPESDEWATHCENDHWKEHTRALDELFGQFNTRHAEPFARWAETHLGELREAGTVFYPFSGPDFIFAHLLYPQAETYLLCGLESCEMLPPIDPLPVGEMPKILHGVVEGISHFLRYSYFITKDMRETFHATRLQGVLPALLVFLARSGQHVESVEAVNLDRRGNPIKAGKSPAAGLCIRFRSGEKLRQIYYFQQDLRDAHCPPNHPLLLFAGKLGRPAVFAKSASYLLHESYFSHLREVIFTRCAALVQDPSSVPYRSFAKRGWKVDLHGRYAKTLPVFQNYEQPDLVEACLADAAKTPSLDFGIGYLTNPETASLMIARPPEGRRNAAILGT